jgi:hypothetical protein
MFKSVLFIVSLAIGATPAIAGNRLPLVTIGAGADINGPVIIRDATGRIVLDVPYKSYVRTSAPSRSSIYIVH